VGITACVEPAIALRMTSKATPLYYKCCRVSTLVEWLTLGSIELSRDVETFLYNPQSLQFEPAPERFAQIDR
jgi:hypothetical protein